MEETPIKKYHAFPEDRQKAIKDILGKAPGNMSNTETVFKNIKAKLGIRDGDEAGAVDDEIELSSISGRDSHSKSLSTPSRESSSDMSLTQIYTPPTSPPFDSEDCTQRLWREDIVFRILERTINVIQNEATERMKSNAGQYFHAFEELRLKYDALQEEHHALKLKYKKQQQNIVTTIDENGMDTVIQQTMATINRI